MAYKFQELNRIIRISDSELKDLRHAPKPIPEDSEKVT